jgi:hypothetical protein
LKKIAGLKLATAVVLTMCLVGATGVALAAGPITRDGADYDGAITKDCPVFEVQGDSLHVACTTNPNRSEPARIRYRFLKEYGGVKAPATVSADIDGNCAKVKWMVPVRTLRITVPIQKPACDVVIHSVTWQQP